MKHAAHLLFTGLLSFWCSVHADVPLKWVAVDEAKSKVVESSSAVVEIHGPASLRAIPNTAIKPGKWVLEMEVFSLADVKNILLTPGPPFETAKPRLLPDIGHSEAWTPYTAPLHPPDQAPLGAWKELRITLTIPETGVLQIKNARLRPERQGEFSPKPSAPSKHAAETSVLSAYLSQTFNHKISKISVGTDTLVIQGETSGDSSQLFLAEIPMDFILGKSKPYESLTPLVVSADGTFSITLPRHTLRNGRDSDRLTTRWRVFHKSQTGYTPVSHAHYPDEVVCRSPNLPPAKVTSKKGLGGWRPDRISDGSDEIKDLGISAVTVNLIAIHRFISLTPAPGSTPFEWQGRTYHAREDVLSQFDRTFHEAEKRGQMVSAILLLENTAKASTPEAKLLGHPDTVKESQYAMPNVTSADGLALYGAVLNLIMERWSHDKGPHGRVHHWIVHNEIDFGWVWTNAGVKSDLQYMDLYQRSMRIIDLIARQYDPNARAFITLTHHWAQKGTQYGYGSKRMIELLLDFCRTEGDFPWAMAYHPYPQSLRNPRTWEDQQATFDFNTPKITPKNLEVLDAYMKLPALRFQGQVRPVHLSENGFNSVDYSPKALEDQAAGMAIAWKKIERLSSIESWQYHNWIDSRGEGGLKIGLRKYRDDATDPLGKKPIWFLYQALGTPNEPEIINPYLKTIGISSWDEIIHRGKIE
jgi:hypothetical protein